MAKIFGKWLKYVGNDVKIGLFGNGQICGKWRRSVGNVSNMWGNDLIICQTS